MMQNENILDLANLLLKFADKIVNVAIEDGTNLPWFNGKDCAKLCRNK